MFTAGAFTVTILAAWLADRKNEQDRLMYDRMREEVSPLLLHIRQDLKLVTFLLGGAVVMLGVVADRIH
jgi:hypothetical protein